MFCKQIEDTWMQKSQENRLKFNMRWSRSQPFICCSELKYCWLTFYLFYLFCYHYLEIVQISWRCIRSVKGGSKPAHEWLSVSPLNDVLFLLIICKFISVGLSTRSQISGCLNKVKTSNNQRLGSAFDDLDPRLSLLCGGVICPCKIIYGGCQIRVPRSTIDSFNQRCPIQSRLQSVLEVRSSFAIKYSKMYSNQFKWIKLSALWLTTWAWTVYFDHSLIHSSFRISYIWIIIYSISSHHKSGYI